MSTSTDVRRPRPLGWVEIRLAGGVGPDRTRSTVESTPFRIMIAVCRVHNVPRCQRTLIFQRNGRRSVIQCSAQPSSWVERSTLIIDSNDIEPIPKVQFPIRLLRHIKWEYRSKTNSACQQANTALEKLLVCILYLISSSSADFNRL
jgi:hypothetical protein